MIVINFMCISLKQYSSLLPEWHQERGLAFYIDQCSPQLFNQEAEIAPNKYTLHVLYMMVLCYLEIRYITYYGRDIDGIVLYRNVHGKEITLWVLFISLLKFIIHLHFRLHITLFLVPFVQFWAHYLYYFYIIFERSRQPCWITSGLFTAGAAVIGPARSRDDVEALIVYSASESHALKITTVKRIPQKPRSNFFSLLSVNSFSCKVKSM